MNEIKTVWHWWWGWNPEKIEKWLEEMELDGWNLFQVDFSYIRFKLEKGESRKIRYCIDYQLNVEDTYFELFREDGWELVDDKIAPWYIWHKLYHDERPHIYTDTKSLIERNNRQLMTVGILMPVEIFIFFMLLENGSGRLELALTLFIFIILVFFGYVIAQIYRYNKKLEQSETRL
jgi:hypothetical protein